MDSEIKVESQSKQVLSYIVRRVDYVSRQDAESAGLIGSTNQSIFMVRFHGSSHTHY